MKLTITFERLWDGTERPVIRDENGAVMPKVRAITIQNRYREPMIATIELIVDGENVAMTPRPSDGEAVERPTGRRPKGRNQK